MSATEDPVCRWFERRGGMRTWEVGRSVRITYELRSPVVCCTATRHFFLPLAMDMDQLSDESDRPPRPHRSNYKFRSRENVSSSDSLGLLLASADSEQTNQPLQRLLHSATQQLIAERRRANDAEARARDLATRLNEIKMAALQESEQTMRVLKLVGTIHSLKVFLAAVSVFNVTSGSDS